ncbi:restriction endonuclease subunit S [Exiguobacterium acetylicum]|uniref:restriction endonuclease subunit S n=1 Tax=Exiguobacterium acetylicum TaxID=41170 RepID=UPI00397784F3
MKSNNPELRFKEFKDEWQKVKLRNLTERVRGNDGRMDLPTLTISAANGWLDQKDRFSGNIAGKEQKNYTLLKKGELSYNHGNSKLAKYGMVFVLKNFKEALVPRIYHSFKTTNEASPYFIEAMFATKKPDKELGKLISSGARMDGLLNINYEDFVGINITVPKIDEQNKIGDFILSLESTINLSQQELDALKQTKQGFLQKMFPKDEETVPEVRFSGFLEDWNDCLIGDVATVSMCKRIFKGQTSENGEIPFYKIGTFGKKPDSFISRELYLEYKNKYSYPDKGDILISASGTIGRTVIYDGQESYYQDSNIIWLKRKENKISNLFLYQFYKIVNWNQVEGSTIKRLYNETILSTRIKVPSMQEQIKIGEFFRQLDEVIELKEKEIEALKETKKGFLQKMFI